MVKKATAILGCALGLALTPAAASAAPCDDLGKGAKIGNSTVLYSQSVEDGSIVGADGQKQEGLPKFCRVVARAAPSMASNILIEIWLPDREKWNGKFLGTGNGGFAGSIRSSALAGGVRRGYAVANTDMGTYPAAFQGVGYQAGNGRPDAVQDWGHRATHEMTLVSKELVQRYYGEGARRSYFSGCSTGGHQGLTEAQRYPDDYDAILAGAPGHNRTHLHAMFTWLGLAARKPDALIPPPQMSLWTNAMMKSCVGKDGGSPADTFLTDPTQCRFAPSALLCKPGQGMETCLSQGQVSALDAVYGGTRNPRTGGLIYPPSVRGTEYMFGPAFANPALFRNGGISSDLSRWVFGPDWDAASFDFDGDMARVDQAIGADVNALAPDLSRFAARGGKLIMYHGWADMVVSPIDSILYYDRLFAKGVQKTSFSRLFMAPGMSHCSGGSGPDSFGQGAEYRAGHGPEDDLLAALDTWAETGKAPETVLATQYAGGNGFTPPPPDAPVAATRPLCAYPKIARYRSGDPKKAENFTCSPAAPARYETPASEYLR